MLSQMSGLNKLGRTLNVFSKRQHLSHQLVFTTRPASRTANPTSVSVDQPDKQNGLVHATKIRIQHASVDQLDSVLRLIFKKEASPELISLVEERLLSLMTRTTEDSDCEMVSKYLEGKDDYKYQPLCNLIQSLAKLGRRPTPLLKAITSQLILLPKDTSNPGEPKQDCLIETLNSLVRLNYINRTLVAKLINDLTDNLDFTRLNSYQLCSLLKILADIRWRPVTLLRMIHSHIKESYGDQSEASRHVIVNFLQTIALLNFKPEDNIKEFYEKHMAGLPEQKLNRFPKKWLDYVYALVCLRVASESHYRSVLSEKFFEDINKNLILLPGNRVKLLNLKALAQYELKLEGLECSHLAPSQQQVDTRKAVMEKTVDKVAEALNGINITPSDVRRNIQTPFGFVIDFELLLDSNMQPIPQDNVDFFSPTLDPDLLEPLDSCHRCAIICSPYEDTIANSLNEVVGYKRIISRIMRSLNYNTIFLSENLINQSTTSAELSQKLLEIFKTVLLKEEGAIKED